MFALAYYFLHGLESILRCIYTVYQKTGSLLYFQTTLYAEPRTSALNMTLPATAARSPAAID